jgi:hypothetical protein
MTLVKAQEIYTKIEEAYIACLAGAEYTITIGATTRRFKPQDMDMLKKEMNYWSSVVDDLTAGRTGMTVKFGVIKA